MTDPEPRIIELLMRAVDGLLDAGDQAEFDRLIQHDPVLRAEYEEMRAVKLQTDGLAARIRATSPLESPATRRTVGGATVAVILGLCLVVAYSMVTFFGDADAPLVVRAGLGMVALGGAALLGHVLVGRLRAGRDPYEEIDR